MEIDGIHFTIGGIVALAGGVLGIIRLIAAVRPWFDWRRRVDVRLAALETEDTEAMKEKLL